jgi:hypothetical protein
MKAWDRQFAMSILLFTAAAAVFLAGLYLLVRRTGLAGCAVLLGVLAAFLRWFYRGKRPDLPPEGHSDRWISGG